jgi:hypothetical protein
MKKNLISSVIVTLVIISTLFGCKNSNPTSCYPNPTVSVDTTKYTDVVLVNNSNLDSVEVFITLPSTSSIIGKFGMDSSNIYIKCMNIQNNDTTYCPCKGKFWAKKGVEYHLGDSLALNSVVVSWGVDNQACTAAQSIVDSKGKQLYPYGLNIFEFTVNTWYQNGITTGSNESFDISCVDGLHSVLKQHVTSFGPRNDVGLNPNFSSYWDYGYIDSTGHHAKFKESMNGVSFKSCINIPGVFPYQCDWGYRQYSPPPACSDPSYPVECSTKWGNINTSQLNRPGQGGRITCEFLGYTKDAIPVLK